MVNAAMLPFTNIFGAKEGHGLSPFCKNFSSKEELVAALKYLFSSKISAQNNRDSSKESDSSKDSDGNGLSHEMESDDGESENELHVKIIGFMVNSLQKESSRSRD